MLIEASNDWKRKTNITYPLIHFPYYLIKYFSASSPDSVVSSSGLLTVKSYVRSANLNSAVNNLDEDTFELDLVQSGLITINIDLFNSGEENSVLEYAVFTSTDAAGVEIENDKGYVSINDSKSAVIYLNPDYIEEGTSSFDVIVNSNGQAGESSQTYKVIINKYYSSYYQDWSFPEEKPTILTNPVVLTRYTYTGREYNREINQYYYRARTYMSSIGRFTGKDNCPNCYPFYKYVNNNPLKYSDSSGRKIDQIFANIVDKYLDVVVADQGGTIEAFWEEMIKGPGRYGNESFEECLDRHLPDVNILDEKINLDGYQQFGIYEGITAYTLFNSIAGLATGVEAGENVVFTVSFWTTGTGGSLIAASFAGFATGYSIGTLLDCGLIKENK